MNENIKLAPPAPRGHFFHGQAQHLLFLLTLVPGTICLVTPSLEGQLFLGVTDYRWVQLSIALAILHQVMVWFVFRAQLCFALLSRLFGDADLTIWGFIFLPLLVARPLLLMAIGISDCGSLPIAQPIAWAIGGVLLLPAFYTIWSVKKYFGFKRAIGGDHFREVYRQMPLVSSGAFKYNTNAMYTLGFLMLWAIAFLWRSTAALDVVLFQHAYIWVHMYCTEAPDLVLLRKMGLFANNEQGYNTPGKK